jgi:glucose-1-phosphate adenylyltransferase
VQIDQNRKVLSFAEKPKGEALQAMKVDTTVLGLSKEEAEQKPFIASMGIYVFKKGVLGERLLLQLLRNGWLMGVRNMCLVLWL